MAEKQRLQMRDALLPLVGAEGYRRVLTVMYSRQVLQATTKVSPQAIHRVEALSLSRGVMAIPRHEVALESDSKSRIYVVQTRLQTGESFNLVLKWYGGKRQPAAAVEHRMNAYFRQCLTPYCTVGAILAVVPLAAPEPLSVAILPYLGDTTLYNHFHCLSDHTTPVVALLRQASETLARAQVLGRWGHEAQRIALTHLGPDEATLYFLRQIDSVLLQTFAMSGQALPMADALLEQFTFFAALLAADSCSAGLYYRGINPRNIMWMEAQQVEIDFEQDTLRSRFIDIVSLLENGLEMADWDTTVDYPAFTSQMVFAAWDGRRRRAWEALAGSNYLTHQQIEALTTAFLDLTLRLEWQYLGRQGAAYSHTERRLLLETARLFRHLQYVGYCKRNEQQALTADKRQSSRYRQQLHALWAKCTLDNLLYPLQPDDDCLPTAGREAAIALRQTLDLLQVPI
ncbi:hypothetical protein NKDENANG_02519 [Candidatus Entotheonellaceae bacterium PAL068K]